MAKFQRFLEGGMVTIQSFTQNRFRGMQKTDSELYTKPIHILET